MSDDLQIALVTVRQLELICNNPMSYDFTAAHLRYVCAGESLQSLCDLFL
jgi:hypothetical protein